MLILSPLQIVFQANQSTLANNSIEFSLMFVAISAAEIV